MLLKNWRTVLYVLPTELTLNAVHLSIISHTAIGVAKEDVMKHGSTFSPFATH